ncbi:MAG: metal ABC transporter substrate-binding protein [Marinilabiliales bacterium]|nr:metal ABC transporter substrate-binding protein [Marinilabiliales bacterium]
MIKFFLPLSILLLLMGCNHPMRNKTEKSVVATNGWTAAFARAAGARHVVVLAPANMVHPSEYELKASDIQSIQEADLFVYAGYESMVEKLQTGIKLKEGVLLRIETDYRLTTMEKSIKTIAEKLGTESYATQSIDSIRQLMGVCKEKLSQSGQNKKAVLANFFQQSILQELGYEIVGLFGPAPLEVADIDRLARTQARLIADNEHNLISEPIARIKPELAVVTLLNFPGLHGTSSLQEVIQYNFLQLQKAK